MAKNPKNQKSWEKRFDKRFNKEVVVMGDYLFEDIKSFIQAELIRELESLRMEEVDIDKVLNPNRSGCGPSESMPGSPHNTQLVARLKGRNEVIQEQNKKIAQRRKELKND